MACRGVGLSRAVSCLMRKGNPVLKLRQVLEGFLGYNAWLKTVERSPLVASLPLGTASAERAARSSKVSTPRAPRICRKLVRVMKQGNWAKRSSWSPMK